MGFGLNQVVADTSVSWANNDPTPTVKTIDISLLNGRQPEARYVVLILNKGASALSITIYNKEIFLAGQSGEETAYARIVATGVLANDCVSVEIEGGFIGEGLRITLSNDSVVGAAGAFAAKVKVRKV